MRVTLSEVQRNIAIVANRVEYTPDIIYELLAAYGRAAAAITQLRTGHLNKAEDENSVLQKDVVYFRVYPKDTQLESKVQELYEDPLTERYKPRYLIATDLINLAAKDTVKGTTLSIKLADIDNELDFFYAWTGDEVVDTKTEAVADRRAADKMNELYVEIEKENQALFTKNANFRHELNIFFTRLLFCFFAEDTEIFHDKQFTDAIKKFTQPDGSDLSWFFGELFFALNTKDEDKPSLKKPFSDFPYVNGTIFDTVKHSIAIPKFSAQARHLIIECGRQNWSEINPDIFGTMFQGIVDPDRRDESGMDYTSVPNIMKVIQPLFLDELHELYDKYYDNEKKLWELFRRIGAIKIFDPACGSGNFLIISFKELRQLQHAIVARINDMKAGGLVMKIPSQNLLDVDNLFGIEIDDFARELAVLSIFLAKHQMNMEFNKQFGTSLSIIPLIELKTIVHGNAARLEWQEVCPNVGHTVTSNEQSALFELEGYQVELKLGETLFDEIYLIGNPPYKGGKKIKNPVMKEDVKVAHIGMPYSKNVDYISIWFMKAGRFIKGTRAKYAFVSTNSICQGEQVGMIWPYLFHDICLEIIFAHTSFKWRNSARDQAGVTCVIVGLANKGQEKDKYLFVDGLRAKVTSINAYLAPDSSDTIVVKNTKPITHLPQMVLGNMAKDGGALMLDRFERDRMIDADQRTEKYIKKLVGADDFINGKERFCIWVEDSEAEDARSIPILGEHFKSVEEYRLGSDAESTKAFAKKSHRFIQRSYRPGGAIFIPSVSSERREYIPVGRIEATDIVVAPNFAIYTDELWPIAILSSKIHVMWIRSVCGSLETRLRYSSALGYNTFPLGPITAEQKIQLQKSARNILIARASYPEKTLGEMYDPDKMPADLCEAHNENDHIVDNLYKKGGFKNDAERLAVLFELYEKMTAKE